VHLAELIGPSDSRAALFDAAKQKKIQGLIERGTWKAFLKDEMPENPNIMSCRFVLTIKDSSTSKERCKARYVVQGFRDKKKTSLVNDASTSKQQSTKLLIGLAAIFGYRILSTDVTQAYLQSAELLMRDVYIKPSAEFELNASQVLKLLRPLYGLADSGDYWGSTLLNHLKEELGMKQTVGDPAMIFKVFDNKQQGVCATYVDDALHTGSKVYEGITEKTMKRFKCRDKEMDNVTFAGVEINTGSDFFHLHQQRYISTLDTLSDSSTFQRYRSLRAKLSYAANTRPDMSCAIAQAAQVTDSMYAKKQLTDIKVLTAVVKHLRKTASFTLKYPKIDINSLTLKVYTDASCANNFDGSSQLEYIISGRRERKMSADCLVVPQVASRDVVSTWE
jgi:Reverse transcriptase (RNA-dependent DNA polymerase)